MEETTDRFHLTAQPHFDTMPGMKHVKHNSAVYIATAAAAAGQAPALACCAS